ncbi:MAG TPA: hypothetical protein VJT71_14640, partial [Pyrinomonadaceae bacterium]|nr:hypothetical protein [Pyrinomonadaceae bacterium]
MRDQLRHPFQSWRVSPINKAGNSAHKFKLRKADPTLRRKSSNNLTGILFQNRFLDRKSRFGLEPHIRFEVTVRDIVANNIAGSAAFSRRNHNPVMGEGGGQPPADIVSNQISVAVIYHDVAKPDIVEIIDPLR